VLKNEIKALNPILRLVGFVELKLDVATAHHLCKWQEFYNRKAP